MSISAEAPIRSIRSYVPKTALAKSVEFDEEVMRVFFTDGRVLSVPVQWFPVLRRASHEQRQRYEIGGGGISLHWPDLDEDLSIAGLMAGVDPQSGQRRVGHSGPATRRPELLRKRPAPPSRNRHPAAAAHRTRPPSDGRRIGRTGRHPIRDAAAVRMVAVSRWAAAAGA